MLLGECAQLVEEGLSLCCILLAGDLVQTVDEYAGDVVVAGMDAADKAEQTLVALDRVLLCVDQASVVRDIESQLIAARNADNTSLFFFYCSVYLINELLGLAGAGAADNKFYHSFVLPTFEVAISVP